MTRIAALTAVVALGVALTGCTKVQQGAAAGGALGAVAGAIWGHNTNYITQTQGIAFGASAGAATGGLAGDAYAKLTEDDLEREMENMRNQLAAKDAELATLQGQQADPAAIAELEAARNELAAALDRMQRMAHELANAQQALADSNSRMNQKDQDVARLQGDLLRAKSDANAKQSELDRIQQELDALKAERDKASQRSSELEGELQQRSDELNRTREEVSAIQASLAERAKAMEALREQLADLNVKLENTSRGLTLTIVDQLLFKAGQADLTADGQTLLAQIADIIHANFPDRELLVEGHTDNQPIVHSGWRSNWELGAGRSLSVVHELVSKHSFKPELISATSFGQYRPTMSNATPEGRAANRRSVIVILPEQLPLQRNTLAGG